MKVSIIGGDRRQRILAELLERRGDTVTRFALGEPKRESASLPEAIDGADCVLLPVPMSRDGVSVFAPLSEKKVLLQEIWRSIQPGQIVLGGGKPERSGIQFENLLEREMLTQCGAIATAEGALSLLISLLPVTLNETQILITGFGRIGKHLSGLLLASGARVMAAVRREEAAQEVREAGICAVMLSDMREILPNQRAVINTVPTILLQEGELRALRKDCLCLELSSEPGGFDRDCMAKLGLNYCAAPGLPGKTAPETMAAAMLETMDRIGKEKGLWQKN